MSNVRINGVTHASVGWNPGTTRCGLRYVPGETDLEVDCMACITLPEPSRYDQCCCEVEKLQIRLVQNQVNEALKKLMEKL